MSEHIKKQIKTLSEKIKSKESELSELRRELIELEDKLKYDNIGFTIKCSPSSIMLAHNMKPGDIHLDTYYYEADGNTYARSSKERGEYTEKLFREYLASTFPAKKCVIGTCNDEALNVIGRIIDSEHIVPNDVEVILYDEDNPEGRVCHFSRDGYIINWPIGCLSYC